MCILRESPYWITSSARSGVDETFKSDCFTGTSRYHFFFRNIRNPLRYFFIDRRYIFLLQENLITSGACGMFEYNRNCMSFDFTQNLFNRGILGNV